MLGPDRAEIVDERGGLSVSPSPSPSSVYGEDVFTWDRGWMHGDMGERRLSSISIATTIICASDLQDGNLPLKGQAIESKYLLSAPPSPVIHPVSPKHRPQTPPYQYVCPSSPVPLHIPKVRIHTCE